MTLRSPPSSHQEVEDGGWPEDESKHYQPNNGALRLSLVLLNRLLFSWGWSGPSSRFIKPGLQVWLGSLAELTQILSLTPVTIHLPSFKHFWMGDHHEPTCLRVSAAILNNSAIGPDLWGLNSSKAAAQCNSLLKLNTSNRVATQFLTLLP